MIEKARLHSVLSIAEEGEIDLSVLSGRRSDIDAQVVSGAFLEALRIEHDFDLRIVAPGIVEHDIRHHIANGSVSRDVFTR